MAVTKCYCVELSPRKKSIHRLRMSRILYVLVVTSFMASYCVADTEESCANVRSFFEKKGMLSAVDMQEQLNSGECNACRCKQRSARPMYSHSYDNEDNDYTYRLHGLLSPLYSL